MQTILRAEGQAALFKGAVARMVFMAPSTAITMTVYEEILKMLR